MANKPSASTTTSTEVRELLRTAARNLSAREEKALRMLQGAPVSADEPLPRRGQKHPEARAELAALELELLQKQRERAAAAPAVKPQPSREKDKIVRALRRLK
jgi:hypothetical protein